MNCPVVDASHQRDTTLLYIFTALPGALSPQTRIEETRESKYVIFDLGNDKCQFERLAVISVEHRELNDTMT